MQITTRPLNIPETNWEISAAFIIQKNCIIKTIAERIATISQSIQRNWMPTWPNGSTRGTLLYSKSRLLIFFDIISKAGARRSRILKLRSSACDSMMFKIRAFVSRWIACTSPRVGTSTSMLSTAWGVVGSFSDAFACFLHQPSWER